MFIPAIEGVNGGPFNGNHSLSVSQPRHGWIFDRTHIDPLQGLAHQNAHNIIVYSSQILLGLEWEWGPIECWPGVFLNSEEMNSLQQDFASGGRSVVR